MDPDFQAKGVGAKLKFAQQEYARCEGIELIAWAFDPLQAGNASFNLGYLGATVREYVENMYGTRTDALNMNMPTDRIIVEWETAPRNRRSSFPPDLPLAVHSEPRPDGLLDVKDVNTGLGAPFLALEIPADIGQVGKRDLQLALRWRDVIRAAFKAYLGRGYYASSFLRQDVEGLRRCFYILEKGR